MTATDRAGQDLKPGDTVEFVFGGEYFTAQVAEIKPYPGDRMGIVATIPVHVHDATVTRTKRHHSAPAHTDHKPGSDTKPNGDTKPTASITTDKKEK